MSLHVSCPNCHASLNAPDHAAGKSTKCPKCHSPLSIPAAVPDHAGALEVVEDDAPLRAKPVTSAAKSDSRMRTASRDDDQDDDRDDGFDRPRKRKKRKAAKSSNLVLFLVLGGLAILVVGIGGIVFAVGSIKSINNKAQQQLVNRTWISVNHSNYWLTMNLPGQPKSHQFPNAQPGADYEAYEFTEGDSQYFYVMSGVNPNLAVMRTKDEIIEDIISRMYQHESRYTLSHRLNCQVSGHSGKQFHYTLRRERGIIRVVVAHNVAYMFCVARIDREVHDTDADVQKFFGGIQIR